MKDVTFYNLYDKDDFMANYIIEALKPYIIPEIYDITTIEEKSLYVTDIFNEIIFYCDENKNKKEDKILFCISNILKNISCNYYFNSLKYIQDIKVVIINILEDLIKKREIYIGENNILDIIKESNILEANIEKIVMYILKYLNINEHIDINKFNCLNKKLKEVVSWYINNFVKKINLIKDKLAPIQFKEITYNDILESYKIEKLCYKEESVSLPEVTYKWYKYNNLTLICVKDENNKKLIGFINILPIKKTFFNKLLSGTFDDTNISLKEIEKYDKKGFYDLYIASICIHPKYNKIKVFSIMYTMFLDLILTLYKKDIYFKNILADCVTNKGLNLSKSIGMKKEIDTNHNTSLYRLSINKHTIDNIRLIGKKGKEVISLYKKILK